MVFECKRVGINRFRTSLHRGRNVRREQLNVPRREGATLLGLPWGQGKTILSAVSFPQEKADPSKQGILNKVTRIYDPLGLASPISLSGKTPLL